MLADPRTFPTPDAADARSRSLHALASQALEASTGAIADALQREIAHAVETLVDDGDGASLSRLLASSPSPAVYRHLWRAIVAAVERPPAAPPAPVLFALPVIVVAASDDTDEHAVDAIVDRPGELAAILVEHGALGGHRQVALAGALCAADAIDARAMPALMRAIASTDTFAPLDVAPAPLVAAPGGERVHLRFLVGSALAASSAALVGDARVGAWGVPLARALSQRLARRGASIVALPRAPQSPPAAIATGSTVRREAGATLFASNAVRRLRASVGEPVAVISAHRAASAPLGGELRLSLSSPLEPREAEGFRCPLDALDRVGDVAAMLAEVARDCRIADVRVLSGVHADRDEATGLTLMFKPDTMPPGAETAAH
jgi:hypothetical protein